MTVVVLDWPATDPRIERLRSFDEEIGADRAVLGWYVPLSRLLAGSSDRVELLKDRSNAGCDLLQTDKRRQPLFVENALRGRPALSFSMHRGDGFLWPGSLRGGSDAEFTVAGVIRAAPSGARSNRYILGSDGSCPEAAFLAVRDESELRASVGTAGLGVSQAVVKKKFLPGDYFAFVWSWNGASQTCSLSSDGGSSFSESSLSGASFGGSRFAVGGARAANEVLVRAASWDFCDLIIYDIDVRNRAERDRLRILRSYFAARYGFHLDRAHI